MTDLKRDCIFIGVTGGSASGKTSLCHEVQQRLAGTGITCEVLSADNWYHSNNANFDCPGAYDWKELRKCLTNLRKFKDTTRPDYDYATHQRTGKRIAITKADCYFVEGILVLHDLQLCELYNLKVFVDAPGDTRLIRRIRRDMIERGRELDSVLTQHETMVKPGYDEYIEPTKRNADIIVPNIKGSLNTIATKLIATHIQEHFKQ